MEAIIVIGPARSGKTLNRLAMMKHYNCSCVYDADEYELTKATGRVLVLAQKQPRNPHNRKRKLEGRIITIETAKKDIGCEWVEPLPRK